MNADDDVLVIGTRGSALALWQAHAFADAVKAARPSVCTRIEVVSTLGDRNLQAALDKVGDKGVFTKELEAALVIGRVDVCVHSMKDVPDTLAPGCVIAGVLPRADARDALVCGPRIAQASDLVQVPEGSRIATGSLRRAAQLRARFPQIVPSPVRGNVETRLRKAEGDEYEGAVLACAGLDRLGLSDHIAWRIDPSQMIPAVGQGAVGIEARADDDRVLELIALVNDEPTLRAVNAERIILMELNGSCKVPMGAYAREETDGSGTAHLVFDAFVSNLDGTRMARSHLELAEDTPPDLAARTALDQLMAQGAREIRDSIASWPDVPQKEEGR